MIQGKTYPVINPSTHCEQDGAIFKSVCLSACRIAMENDALY